MYMLIYNVNNLQTFGLLCSLTDSIFCLNKFNNFARKKGLQLSNHIKINLHDYTMATSLCLT